MTSRPPTFDRLASAVSGQTLSDGTEAWWDYPGFLHLTFGVDRLTVCVNPDEDSPRTTLVVQIDDDGRYANDDPPFAGIVPSEVDYEITGVDDEARLRAVLTTVATAVRTAMGLPPEETDR